MNELMNRPQSSDAIQELEVLDRSDGKSDLEQYSEGIQMDDRAVDRVNFVEECNSDYTRCEGFSKETYQDCNISHSIPVEQNVQLNFTLLREFWLVAKELDEFTLQKYDKTVFCIHKVSETTLSEIFQLNPNLAIVIALNSDKRELKVVKSWIEKCKAIGFKTISVAITNDEDTWNDKHKKNALKPEDIEEYLYNGSLLMAESVLKKAYLIHEHNNVNQFIFEFDDKTYWAKRDEKQKESERHDPLAIFQSEYQIIEIANCTFTFLYAQKMLGSNDLLYFIEVSTDRDRNVAALSSKQLSSAGEFKTTVMNIIAGATFTGETKNLDTLYKLKTTNIYNIEATNFMGYAEEFGAYIFKDFAVYKGVVYKANQHEYIELPNNVRVKTTFHLPDFNPVMHYQNDWWDDYLDVFGVKGVAVLAYWFGSLFAEQIRSVYKAYPFLELTGDPSSGKSMILRFLWSLLGRHDYEGANPNLGTDTNYLRTLAQVGNLPVVMIECEGFSLENLKAAFNGGILRATAKKDLSNETYSPKFRTVLIICQNDRVITLGSKFNQEALLSRMISVAFDKTRHTPERAVKARRLELLSVEDVSGFLIASLKLELQAMNAIQSTFEANRQRIMDLGIKEGRIGLTHGLMLSLVDALSLIVPLNQSVKNEVFTYIDQIALERDLELKQDHPMLEQFWDVYDNLSAQNYPVNHACDPKMIAINLTQFYALATEHRYLLDDIREVKKLLPTSTRYKFIAKNKETYSRFYTHKTSTKASRIVRAYVFQKLDQE